MKRVALEKRLIASLIIEPNNAEMIDEKIILNSENKKIYKYAIKNKKIEIGELAEIINNNHLEEILEIDCIYKTDHYYSQLRAFNNKKRLLLDVEKLKQAIEIGELAETRNLIEKIENQTTRKQDKPNLKKFDEVTQEYFDRYNEKSRYLETGILTLDRIFKAAPTDLVVLAARPSIGKTAFQLELVLQYAIKGYKVLVYSLEMSNYQLSQRMLANLSNIELNKVKYKTLSGNEKTKLQNKREKYKNLDIVFNDNASVTLEQIKNTAKKQKKSNGLNIIFVDFLQLMGVNIDIGNRNQEIGYITRQLKILAMELDVTIIILSQLSRGVEQRIDKRPVLSDLRDSGEVEQNVNSALFLYRDDYYNENSEMKGVIEVIVRKNRDGELGTAYLKFLRETQKFQELGK